MMIKIKNLLVAISTPVLNFHGPKLLASCVSPVRLFFKQNLIFFNEYSNCFKINIYYRCISRIQFSSSGYYKLKYYHQTKMLHRCSYKIILIIKTLQCFKVIKKQYNNILDLNGDQLKLTVTTKNYKSGNTNKRK